MVLSDPFFVSKVRTLIHSIRINFPCKIDVEWNHGPPKIMELYTSSHFLIARPTLKEGIPPSVKS